MQQRILNATVTISNKQLKSSLKNTTIHSSTVTCLQNFYANKFAHSVDIIYQYLDSAVEIVEF